MKVSQTVVVLAVLPIFVAAHADKLAARHVRHLDARQAPPSSSSVAGAPGTSVSSKPAPVSGTATGTPAPPPPPTPTPTPTGTGAAAGTTSAPSATTPSITVTLRSTNPTAVPLSDIVSNQSSSPTIPLPSTAVVGATPTAIPNAPPLPNAALLSPTNYPALDKVPPVDSPEVQQWITEVMATGVEIPGLSITNPGGCPNNTDIVNDASRCWWTCGGCTGTTDVTQCPQPLNWGLTYDDGPGFYTPNLLTYLDQQQLKSTFFVVGSRVISFPSTLQEEYMAGHQIAVHTWSHPSLTTLTTEEIIAELGWSKKVIKDVLGVTPNMMRPPFGDIDNRVRAISLAMGLTPVIWSRISPLATFDTGDFNLPGGTTTSEQVLQNWEDIIGNATTRSTGFIVLEHDLFEQTVEIATGYILPDALAHQPPFTIRPVINCMNESLANAYIETNDNSTNPPAISAGVASGVITISQTAGGASPTGNSGSGGKSGATSVRVSSGLAVLTTLSGLLVAAFSLLA